MGLHFLKLACTTSVCFFMQSISTLAYAQSQSSEVVASGDTQKSSATENSNAADETITNERVVSSEFKIGLDSWHIAHGIPQNPESINPYLTRESLREQTGLPDVTPGRQYLDLAPWATALVNYQATPEVKLNLKAMVTQGFGGRVDEFNADYALSGSLGFRAGIVDYKMSWCGEYESDPVWIHDPNKFCSDPQNKALTSAAPGAQVYWNKVLGKYQIQSIAGIYNPKVFGYDNLENGRRYYLGEYDTNSNHKYGFAFNLLNTKNATEYRVSWLHSDINESPNYRYQPTTSNSQQENDTLYLAMHTMLGKRVTLSVNAWFFDSELTDDFNLYTTDYYDYRFRYNISISGVDINLHYAADNKNRYTVGYTQSQRHKLFTPIDQSDPRNPIEHEKDEHFKDIHQAFALAWRHDWAYNITSTLQFIHTEMYSRYRESIEGNNPIFSSSNALGVRMAYRF